MKGPIIDTELTVDPGAGAMVPPRGRDDDAWRGPDEQGDDDAARRARARRAARWPSDLAFGVEDVRGLVAGFLHRPPSTVSVGVVAPGSISVSAVGATVEDLVAAHDHMRTVAPLGLCFHMTNRAPQGDIAHARGATLDDLAGLYGVERHPDRRRW